MIKNDLLNVLSCLVEETEWLEHIYCANDKNDPPLYSYQVNFPRLEITLKGKYTNQIGQSEQFNNSRVNMLMGDALFLPANYWNKPTWDEDCVVLAILLGKRQIGFSLLAKHKGSDSFYDVKKYSLQLSTHNLIEPLITAMQGAAFNRSSDYFNQLTLKLLIKSLLCHILTLMSSTTSNSKNDIFHLMCLFIQENYSKDITRGDIASYFNITANHVSRIFKKNGDISFNQYLILVRIERAKFMLVRYNFRLNEIAKRCGFKDPNYFFRTFKLLVGMTPKSFRLLNKTS